jgi:hypothetical protein
MDTLITINRQVYDADCTIGEMLWNGVHFCWTLEPTWRPATDPKVFGHTAIPPGKYPLTMTMSPHFGKMMPLLIGVLNFEAVRIHAGNFPSNTEGCTLVGAAKGKDEILQSALESEFFNEKLADALKQGNVFAEYIDDIEHAIHNETVS